MLDAILKYARCCRSDKRQGREEDRRVTVILRRACHDCCGIFHQDCNDILSPPLYRMPGLMRTGGRWRSIPDLDDNNMRDNGVAAVGFRLLGTALRLSSGASSFSPINRFADGAPSSSKHHSKRAPRYGII